MDRTHSTKRRGPTVLIKKKEKSFGEMRTFAINRVRLTKEDTNLSKILKFWARVCQIMRVSKLFFCIVFELRVAQIVPLFGNSYWNCSNCSIHGHFLLGTEQLGFVLNQIIISWMFFSMDLELSWMGVIFRWFLDNLLKNLNLNDFGHSVFCFFTLMRYF